MGKNLRSVLRGNGVRVSQLEGNAAAREDAGVLRGGRRVPAQPRRLLRRPALAAREARGVFARMVGDVGTVREVEAQAIARCLRYGQTREVIVHSFVVSDCAEELVWNGTHGASE